MVRPHITIARHFWAVYSCVSWRTRSCETQRRGGRPPTSSGRMSHSFEDHAGSMWAVHILQPFSHHLFAVRLILASLSAALIAWFLNKTLLQPYLIYLNLKRQGVKGVPFRPLIGQLPEMREHMRRKKSDPQYAKIFFFQSREAIAKYGDVHMSQMGPDIDLVLSSPEAIKEVLVTKAGCFQKPAYVKRLLALMGNGLVFSEGALWERQRRVINPAFNHKEIKASASPASIHDPFSTLDRSSRVIDCLPLAWPCQGWLFET